MKYRKTLLLIAALALSASAYASDTAFPDSYEPAGTGILRAERRHDVDQQGTDLYQPELPRSDKNRTAGRAVQPQRNTFPQNFYRVYEHDTA